MPLTEKTPTDGAVVPSPTGRGPLDRSRRTLNTGTDPRPGRNTARPIKSRITPTKRRRDAAETADELDPDDEFADEGPRPRPRVGPAPENRPAMTSRS